jgi:two-component system, cell cycle response regulator
MRVGNISGEKLRPPSVLVVEDDPEQLGALCGVLTQEGYSCFTASNGVEGLAILDRVRADVIVLDLMMPKMNGWDFLEALRKRPGGRDMAVIVVSAFYDARRELGPVRYLPKPYRLDAILGAVAAAVGRSELG